MSEDVKELVKKDYLLGMKLNDICEKYDIKPNTFKSWRTRYKWADEKNKKGAPQKSKGGAPLGNKNAVGHGAPKGNKNAVGNDGGAPARNKNAETHGFFSKYLPEETLNLVQEIEEKHPLDILWENITIQYAAIMRAQKLMYVKDQEDTTEFLKKHKRHEGMSFSEEKEYEVQFAWDKHATFLQAQSRAMSELRNMIKQYEELSNSGLGTEEQRLRIDKLKLEIERVQGDKNKSDGVEEWVSALQEIAEKRKKIKNE